MCSPGALVLDLVYGTQPVTEGLLDFLRGGATDIAAGLAEDPAEEGYALARCVGSDASSTSPDAYFGSDARDEPE